MAEYKLSLTAPQIDEKLLKIPDNWAEISDDLRGSLIGQTFNANSSNAQSGIAVAQALQGYVQSAESDGITDKAYVINASGVNTTINVENTGAYSTGESVFANAIPRRNEEGKLLTVFPTADLEAANKAYVDNAINQLAADTGKLFVVPFYSSNLGASDITEEQKAEVFSIVQEIKANKDDCTVYIRIGDSKYIPAIVDIAPRVTTIIAIMYADAYTNKYTITITGSGAVDFKQDTAYIRVSFIDEIDSDTKVPTGSTVVNYVANKFAEHVDELHAQPDWNQADETAIDYIKNKPQVATDEDIMDLISELNYIVPVTTSTGDVLTNNVGEIYTI